MTLRQRAALLGCVVVVLLGLGGCGEGSGARALAAPVAPPAGGASNGIDDTTDPEMLDTEVTRTPRDQASDPPTRRSFLLEGNALCAAGSAGLAVIGSDVEDDDETALLAVITGRVVPNVRGQVAGLRALGYPAGDGRRLSGILEDTDAVLDAWASDPTMAFTDTRMDAIHDRLYDYGLTSCGES